MSLISGELVSKLDSKTAKTGDSVVVQTKSSAKTADGTEIPKGSKLVGHVVGAQAGGAGENSQVALLFDHIELKGGQSVPVQSQIQSIAPAGGAASASGPAGMSGAPAGSPSSPSANGANNGSGPVVRSAQAATLELPPGKQWPGGRDRRSQNRPDRDQHDVDSRLLLARTTRRGNKIPEWPVFQHPARREAR